MRAIKLRNMKENIFGCTTGIYLHTHIHTLAGTQGNSPLPLPI